jgi:hypothetical protein
MAARPASETVGMQICRHVDMQTCRHAYRLDGWQLGQYRLNKCGKRLAA